MDPADRPNHRIWLTGHSSGGALSQLFALRLALLAGPGRVGGVLLFNSDRVGSAGFAAFYDTLLGPVTTRFGYGLGAPAPRPSAPGAAPPRACRHVRWGEH
jgi:pimeloyl-ACP methyl ester carboxylesterase